MIFTFSVHETYSVGLARFKRSFRYRIYLNRTKTQRFQMINNTKLREVNVNTAYFPILARINMSVNVVNLSKKEHLSSNSLIKRSGKRKKKARVKITISIARTSSRNYILLFACVDHSKWLTIQLCSASNRKLSFQFLLNIEHKTVLGSGCLSGCDHVLRW